VANRRILEWSSIHHRVLSIQEEQKVSPLSTQKCVWLLVLIELPIQHTTYVFRSKTDQQRTVTYYHVSGNHRSPRFLHILSNSCVTHTKSRNIRQYVANLRFSGRWGLQQTETTTQQLNDHCWECRRVVLSTPRASRILYVVHKTVGFIVWCTHFL